VSNFSARLRCEDREIESFSYREATFPSTLLSRQQFPFITGETTIACVQECRRSFSPRAMPLLWWVTLRSAPFPPLHRVARSQSELWLRVTTRRVQTTAVPLSYPVARRYRLLLNPILSASINSNRILFFFSYHVAFQNKRKNKWKGYTCIA